MTDQLTDAQKTQIGENLERFHRYCNGVWGSVPTEDSNDWNRLALAWLAWYTYQPQMHEL